MSKDILPCGCIPGEFDCPKAVELWREVNYQYGLLKGHPSTFEGWKDYDEALAKYREHKGQR